MKNDHIIRSGFLIIIPVGFIFFLFIFSQKSSNNLPSAHLSDNGSTIEHTCEQGITGIKDKHRGAHVFGKIDSTSVQNLHQHNIEWITLVTWAYQDDIDTPIVMPFNTMDSVQISERTARLRRRIELVRAAGFKVFFKPHLWINNPSNRTRRADIFPTGDQGWDLWRNSYTDFIMHCARVAEQTEVEMFCIGTELTKVSSQKPDFWRNLIQEVRRVYSGKITYAANWYDEFEGIPFWDELDYIGIQAYFPLVKNKYPTVKQIARGWNKYVPTLKSVHKKYNRKILFTEMGYKSTADSAIEPWKWPQYTSDQDKLYSAETQANCYAAFFNSIWKKEWFAGVHIWQMRSNYKHVAGKKSLGFSPQGKPAEQTIANGFEK